MNETNRNNQQTARMTQQEAYTRTREYFLGNSLEPAENIPDLLAENRKTALGLAETVMGLVDTIARYFGIPTMELVMEALPEFSLQLEADGVRERAAARTYLDLRGAVPLADVCASTHAYPVPTLHYLTEEMLRRQKRAEYIAHDPLLKRILGAPNRSGTPDDGIDKNDESSGEEDGEEAKEADEGDLSSGEAPPGI